jgi:hypothetical protein
MSQSMTAADYVAMIVLIVPCLFLMCLLPLFVDLARSDGHGSTRPPLWLRTAIFPRRTIMPPESRRLVVPGRVARGEGG